MQITLAEFMRGTAAGSEAEAIVQRCVHCGFCTATCPTYQLLGDELDGPRGRIYLIKQMLEGAVPTQSSQLHLDRCLTCLNCETTCPSGVQYGRLIGIGREVAQRRVARPLRQRMARALVRSLCNGPWFAPALWLGRALRPLLPPVLRRKIPPRRAPGTWPTRQHSRLMLLPAGCVQPSLAPNIDAATARVLDALGIQAVVARHDSGCCGALRHHTDDAAGALTQARRNIDSWWPHIEAGVEAIVMNASGCGAQLREYGHLLREDPVYAERAARISALTRDPAEVIPALLEPQLPLTSGTAPRVVFHPPCSLQHAQRIRGVVEALLRACGAEVLPFRDAHSCCGSAGSYSLLQPGLSAQLREQKVDALLETRPDLILSANVGCITHLAGGSPIPVSHWIEWLDERLEPT